MKQQMLQFHAELLHNLKHHRKENDFNILVELKIIPSYWKKFIENNAFEILCKI